MKYLDKYPNCIGCPVKKWCGTMISCLRLCNSYQENRRNKMNYEQKYKEAIERCKSWIRGEHPECFTEAQKAGEFIFPELRESEDERIRKGLIKGLTAMRDIHKHQTFSDDAINIDDAIAWLEKQGEKTNPYSGVSFEYNGHTWGMCAREGGVDILCDSQLIKHIEKQGEQKPTWSEEDEKMKSLIISTLTSMGTLNLERYYHMNLDEVKEWLKSLKPHWKPSEEQIRVLQTAIRDYGISYEKSIFESLYNDLKSL